MGLVSSTIGLLLSVANVILLPYNLCIVLSPHVLVGIELFYMLFPHMKFIIGPAPNSRQSNFIYLFSFHLTLGNSHCIHTPLKIRILHLISDKQLNGWVEEIRTFFPTCHFRNVWNSIFENRMLEGRSFASSSTQLFNSQLDSHIGFGWNFVRKGREASYRVLIP